MDNVHNFMKKKMHLSSYNLQEVLLNILLNIFLFFFKPSPSSVSDSLKKADHRNAEGEVKSLNC